MTHYSLIEVCILQFSSTRHEIEKLKEIYKELSPFPKQILIYYFLEAYNREFSILAIN